MAKSSTSISPITSHKTNINLHLVNIINPTTVLVFAHTELKNVLGTGLVERDWREVVATSGEVGGDRGQVALGADLKHQAHTDDDVEQEVAMEEPEAGVVSSETKDDVAVVRHSDCVLRGRQISLFKVTLEQTSPVEVKSVLQVDFLDVLVR